MAAPPRVVVLGLASDFGCQVQMTNIEDDLLDVLGLIELSYWQLASSGHMPDEFEVAIVEGAVTTDAHVEALRRVRAAAGVVIGIGSCALTGGVPAIASRGDLEGRYAAVYGGAAAAPGRSTPAPVTSVIDVDYRVPGCPIGTSELLRVLSRALRRLSDRTPAEPLCATCKTLEKRCFVRHGEVCLGPITRSGCGAKCVSLGRACNGCRGPAPEANMVSFRSALIDNGIDPEAALSRYMLFNALEKGF